MKKGTILLFGVLASFVSQAQQVSLIKADKEVGKSGGLMSHPVSTNGNQKEAILWSEDFSGGIPSSWTNEVFNSAGVLLPNGSWEYRGTGTTPNNTVGSRGAWGPFDAISSPTRSNGFVIFDSDFLDNNGVQGGAGNGSATAPHIGMLITDTIDMTGNAFIELKMHSYARQWNSTEFKVAISNDGGLTYADTVSFHEDLMTNETSARNVVLTANISETAGNQANVVLAFMFDGTQGTAGFQAYYYWMLDDIEIRDLPVNSMRFTEASDGAPAQDILFDGGASGRPKTGTVSLEQVVPVSFDGNIYNYGSQAQTNLTLEVEVYNGGTLAQTLTSPALASLAPGDTATYVDLVTNDWTPTTAGTYRLVYTYSTDSISGTEAARDTFNFIVTDGNDIIGDNTYNLDGLDHGVFSNRFGTDITDLGSDGGGVGVMIPIENGNNLGVVHVEGVQIRFSTGTVNGGDVVIEMYDTTGFDVNNGFASPALISEQYNLPNASGSVRDFKFTTGSGPAGSLVVPEGTYYVVAYFFSNSNNNEIIIGNDASFQQTGFGSIMYFVSDSRWYTGYVGSRTFNSPHVRLITEMATGIGLEEEGLNKLEVFPNPTNGEVNISLTQGGSYTIEVIDMVGNRVHTEEVRINGNEKLSRDYSSLPRGVYLLNVKDGENFSKTTKLTIK
jgi:hypothetical protein